MNNHIIEFQSIGGWILNATVKAEDFAGAEVAGYKSIREMDYSKLSALANEIVNEAKIISIRKL